MTVDKIQDAELETTVAEPKVKTESLYSLTDKAVQLAQYIEDNEGEDLAELLADTIEGLELSIDEKLQAILTIRQNKLGQIDMIAKEMERLKKRQEEAKNEVTRLEKYMDGELRRLGHTYKDKKMKSRDVGKWKIGFKKLPPKLEVVDENKIPFTYMVMQPAPPPSIDRKALLDHLKEKAMAHIEETRDPEKKGKPKLDEIDQFDIEEMGIRLVNSESKLEIK